MAEEFAACSAGLQQSPIDLTGPMPVGIADPGFEYRPGAASVVNNGHTIQVNITDGGQMQLDGKAYQVAQFHFHAPSEHTVDGVPFPLEAHMVHKDEAGNLAVVGVLIGEGPTNPAFDAIIAALPGTDEKGANVTLVEPVDVATLIPSLHAAYRYEGSLTTPPCSEGVHWSVMEATIAMSAEQIEAFTSRFHEPNNRPVQSINDRVIEMDITGG